jgi:hypothetical protein
LTIVGVLVGDAIWHQFASTDIVCTAVPQAGQAATSLDCAGSASATVTVYVPGVVVVSERATQPILGTMREFGDVQLFDFTGDGFDAAKVADALAELLAGDLARYERVNVFAESMGCMVTVESLSSMQVELAPDARAKLNVTLADCPSGRDSISGFSAVTSFYYPGPISNAVANGLFGVGHAIGKLFGAFPGPVQWSWSAGYTNGEIEAGLDVESTRIAQQESSTGFPLSKFADEVRYLAKGLPSMDGLTGIHFTYLMAQPEADKIVTQPQAADDWVAAATAASADFTIRELDFPTDHCDYYSWPTGWNTVIRELLQ